MAPLRIGIRTLVALVLTNGIAPGCSGSGPECTGPGAAVDTSAGTGALPTWAIGGFGRHDIDIVNIRIEADGTAYLALDGGDYGGCGRYLATFTDGRVHLVPEGDTSNDAHRVMVRTSEGRLFEGDSDASDLTCGWHELETHNLCGRDVGGCGGYGSSVPCTWDEANRGMGCEPDSSDDGQPGDGDQSGGD